MVAFIRPLRAEYLTEYVPIIVMGPGFPPSEMWDMFEDVCYVNGSPESRDELEGVGAQHAERVVLLAGPPNPDFEARLADSQAQPKPKPKPSQPSDLGHHPEQPYCMQCNSNPEPSRSA